MSERNRRVLNREFKNSRGRARESLLMPEAALFVSYNRVQSVSGPLLSIVVYSRCSSPSRNSLHADDAPLMRCTA
jgi:hypothetical protein